MGKFEVSNMGSNLFDSRTICCFRIVDIDYSFEYSMSKCLTRINNFRFFFKRFRCGKIWNIVWFVLRSRTICLFRISRYRLQFWGIVCRCHLTESIIFDFFLSSLRHLSSKYGLSRDSRCMTFLLISITVFGIVCRSRTLTESMVIFF
jgi:hypothetical protein